MKKILGLKNIDIFSIAAIIFLSMIAAIREHTFIKEYSIISTALLIFYVFSLIIIMGVTAFRLNTVRKPSQEATSGKSVFSIIILLSILLAAYLILSSSLLEVIYLFV